MTSFSRLGWVVVIGVLLVAACDAGAEDSATTTLEPGVQRQPFGANSYFEINEVGVGPDSWVRLTNFTDVPVTLAGLSICRDGECFDIPDEVVPAGSDVVLHIRGESPGDAQRVEVSGLGELGRAEGELALFVVSSETEELLTFLEWGSAPHSYTDEAIDAGLWVEGSYAPAGDDAIRLYRDRDSGLWLWDAES